MCIHFSTLSSEENDTSHILLGDVEKLYEAAETRPGQNIWQLVLFYFFI